VATELQPTDRTRLRRLPARGTYDRAMAYAILDEALYCNLAFAVDGQPRVLPTIHARVGDDLYFHGATGNAMLRAMAPGAEVCVSVTLVDGLVLSRSWFHHSMNYRSVVVFGRAARVEDPGEKTAALRALVDRIVHGRTAESRPPTDAELRATLVVRVPLAEGSAKVRTGGPVEDPADIGLDHWGGVLPLTLVPGEPVPDEHVAAGTPIPATVASWRRIGG
jgi:uncharacterized protein